MIEENARPDEGELSSAARDSEALLAEGQELEALRLARTALATADGAMHPSRPRLQLITARALIALGRDDEAIETLRSIDVGLPDDEALRVTALLTELRVATGQTTDPIADAERSVEAALRQGVAPAISSAWQSLGMARLYDGHVHEAIEAGEQCVAWASRTDGAAEGEALSRLATLVMHADDFERAASLFDAALAAASTPLVASETVVHRAFLDFHAARWDEAARVLAQRLRHATLRDWVAGLASGMLAMIHVHRDELEAAGAAIDLAPAGVASAPRPFQLWASLLLAEARGDDRAAVTTAERLVRVTGMLRSPVRLRFYGPDVVRVLVRAGDRTAAGHVATILDAVATPARVASITATAALCRGLLEGDPDRIGAAADDLATSPRLFEAAAARLWQAEALEAARRPADAIRAYEVAASGLQAIGAARGARAAERGLRALGRRPGRQGSRARPLTGWASLTPAQRRVAELVGRGLTNAQIASRLVVSSRTVEAHLVEVFAKLGVDSRTRVALVVSERREGPGRD